MDEIKLSPIEVAMLETETWDLKKLCDIYGVPPELLGNGTTDKPKDE